MISKRIKTIAQMIPENSSVIDIGCDHGYLGQILRESGNNALIICSDEKAGPLDNARKNLAGYENILFCLSDGVKEVPTQVQVAVMAGMGHHTVEHILSQRPDYFRQCEKIVIEVNSQVDQMRRWLMDNHYRIVDEEIVEDYKYYEILVVETGEMNLTGQQLLFGPVLLKKRSSTFLDCWKEKLAKLKSILSSLDEGQKDAIELKNKIDQIEKMINQEF